MPSKKAVFEARDPSSTPDSSLGTLKGDDEGTVETASLESKKLSQIDFNTGESVQDTDEVAENSSFYTRDTKLESTDQPELEEKGKYMGVERRRRNRRSRSDRRADVRFDLEKSDRRQYNSRRENDGGPSYW